MSFDVYLKSTTFEHVTPPEPKTLVLRWVVRLLDEEGEVAEFHPFTHWFETWGVIPRAGEKLTGYVAGTTSSDWSDRFRCRGTTWASHDDAPWTWTAESRFTSRESFCPEPHLFRTDAVTPRTVDIYRVQNPTSTMLSSTTTKHAVQSGNRIDEKGKPVEGEVQQQQIQISFVWNTADLAGATGYPNVYTLISEGWIGTLNEEEFLGWPIGTVKLTGVSIDPDEDEYVRVVYQFTADRWGFYSQEPELLPAGTPGGEPCVLDSTGANADPVNWVRPWTGFSDFNQLFDASGNEVSWLIDGWRTWDNADCDAPEEGAMEQAPNKATVGNAAGLRDEPEEA